MSGVDAHLASGHPHQGVRDGPRLGAARHGQWALHRRLQREPRQQGDPVATAAKVSRAEVRAVRQAGPLGQCGGLIQSLRTAAGVVDLLQRDDVGSGRPNDLSHSVQASHGGLDVEGHHPQLRRPDGAAAAGRRHGHRAPSARNAWTIETSGRTGIGVPWRFGGPGGSG